MTKRTREGLPVVHPDAIRDYRRTGAVNGQAAAKSLGKKTLGILENIARENPGVGAFIVDTAARTAQSRDHTVDHIANMASIYELLRLQAEKDQKESERTAETRYASSISAPSEYVP